jgi:hypothetical protein
VNMPLFALRTMLFALIPMGFLSKKFLVEWRKLSSRGHRSVEQLVDCWLDIILHGYCRQ